MTHSNDYCPKCGKKNDKVQVPICGIPVTSSTDGTVISGPENCPWGFPDIKPLSKPEPKEGEYWVINGQVGEIKHTDPNGKGWFYMTFLYQQPYYATPERPATHQEITLYLTERLKQVHKVLPSQWISVEDKPLYTKDKFGRWVCTHEGDGEFIAAVPTNTGWWVKHCLVEDYGLAVVGDSDNEPAGWSMEDVTHYIPMPEGPYKLN